MIKKIIRASIIILIGISIISSFLDQEKKYIPKAKTVILVIDNSFRMQQRDPQGISFIERAKSKAYKLLTSKHFRYEAAILLSSNKWLVFPPSQDIDKLVTKIRRIKTSFKPTDLNEAISMAIQSLRYKKDKEIYVFTNRKSPFLISRYKSIKIVDLNHDSFKPNLCVKKVKILPYFQLSPRTYKIRALISNLSSQSIRDIMVRLIISGKIVAVGFLNLEPYKTETKEFIHTFKKEGIYFGQISLGQDSLSLDNHRYFKISFSSFPILIIEGERNEGFFLSKSLSVFRTLNLRFTSVYVDELQSDSFFKYRVIFLLNIPTLSSQAISRLIEFVERGGGIFISLGDRVKSKVYNGLLREILPRPLYEIRTMDKGRYISFAPFFSSHPLVRVFNKISGFEDLRVWSYFLLAQRRTNSSLVIISFNNSMPALLEKRIKRGRVLLFTSTLDNEWTNLPTRPGYVLLIHQIIKYLGTWGKGKSFEDQLILGKPYSFPVPFGTTQVIIRNPAAKDKVIKPKRETVVFRDTYVPGIYEVIIQTKDKNQRKIPELGFVVNIDPKELGEISRPFKVDLFDLHEAKPKADLPLHYILTALVFILLIILEVPAKINKAQRMS